MDLTQFRATVAQGAPPEGISLALQTLWWDAKGDWDRAHQCAQQDEGKTGSAVHAYLHRKEGDMRNAGGWYSRAGREPPTVSLEEEWQSLAEEMLGLQAAERARALGGSCPLQYQGRPAWCGAGTVDADAKGTTLRMMPYGCMLTAIMAKMRSVRRSISATTCFTEAEP